MKKSILLNDGDVQLVNGNIVLISEDERVRQLIENALSIRKGEWFYNTETGLDHRELDKKNPNIDNLKSDIIDCVTGLEEVNEVTNLEIDYNRQERKADIKFNAIYDLNNIEMEVTI